MYKNRVQVSIAQVVRTPLDLIQELYGGNIYLEERRSPNHNDTHRYVLSKKHLVLRFLKDVYPYLMVKDIKCEEAINFLEGKSPSSPIAT